MVMCRSTISGLISGRTLLFASSSSVCVLVELVLTVLLDWSSSGAPGLLDDPIAVVGSDDNRSGFGSSDNEWAVAQPPFFHPTMSLKPIYLYPSREAILVGPLPLH